MFVISEDNARIMVEERCINDVVSALERHIDSVPLVTAASITLLSLLLEGRQTVSTSPMLSYFRAIICLSPNF